MDSIQFQSIQNSSQYLRKVRTISITNVLLGFLLFVQCSESSLQPDPSRLGFDYFPLQVGTYRIYDVEEVNYTVTEEFESNYELRESVVRKEIDLSGDSIFVLHRHKRLEGEDWVLDSIWTARHESTRAVLVENNIPFVKMVFPIQNDSIWDGNILNIRNTDWYRYDLTRADTLLNGIAYSDIVKVIQSDAGEDILGRDDRIEIYSRGIGLLIKESITLKYCNEEDEQGNTRLCDDIIQVIGGRELRQTLKEHGNE